MTRRTDQIATPLPPVVFATPEAGQRVVTEIRAKYDEAAHYATAQGGLSIQLGEEIAQLEKEISELQVRVIEKDGEKRTAENQARAAQDVANGYADMLAAAGVKVPPFGGEMSHAPDASLDRFGAAHDELERSGAVS
jgi:hypothetical protein